MTLIIPQNQDLLTVLFSLLHAYSMTFGQYRVFERACSLVLAELFVFGRHTITRLALAQGITHASALSPFYRLFSQKRFCEDRVAPILLQQTLKHVPTVTPIVLACDGTQTPRTGKHIEGVGWGRNQRNPPFMVGIHLMQRWLHLGMFLPPDNGFTRLIPLRFLPAFTEKSKRQVYDARKEWEVAVGCLQWLRAQLIGLGRASQQVLLLADGAFDTLNLWKNLPNGVILLVRTAKNRVLYHLPDPNGRKKKYGERARTPQAMWDKALVDWQRCPITIRGKVRWLRYRVEGPVIRERMADKPLFVIVIGGEHYTKHNHPKQREAVAYLVNAVQDATGAWGLPSPVETLIFWAWQRWEIEVCHRELKTTFGLGDKQCWHPEAAVASVQWSAWVYALMVLAGYETWGICDAPPVATGWWRGGGRWSFNTLWQSFRAALWGEFQFRPHRLRIPHDLTKLTREKLGLRDAVYSAWNG
ncbi:MAG: transposase [Anaerolineae bacterium]|nr:transposase [Anaerolineae bacterium]